MHQRGIPLYCTVALSLPFKYHTGGSEGLSYEVPEELIGRAEVGTRVLVPLGKRQMSGVLVALSYDKPAIEGKLRPIVDVLDARPVFDEAFLEWTKWVAKYYMTSWGEVLATALPEGLRPETRSSVTLLTEKPEELAVEMSARAPRRAEVLRRIAQSRGEITIATLTKEIGTKGLYAILHTLEEQGLIRIERSLSRNAGQKVEYVVALAPELTFGSPQLSAAIEELEKRAPRQANILLGVVHQMQTAPDKPLSPQLLMKKAGATQATLKSVLEKGYIVFKRKEIRSSTDEPALRGEGDISRLTLTLEQQHAVELISEQINLHQPRTFLLHGVTGSGKTEVYISLAKKVLAEGGGVLVLVPEIALTPQLIERFKRRLSLADDDQIAVLHSRMSVGERSKAWHSLAEGTVRIAIGARSAVFAPIKDLRLVVVDEEHEMTYKQYDKTPRYNARDIAVVRASMLKAVCVLGSATPSIESYYNGSEGKYQVLHLTERAREAKLPDVRVVDMRTAQNRRDFKNAKMSITPELREAIKARLERKEGVVLFQNRRGFSTYLECTDCGTPEMCPNCTVTMTFHRPKQQMRCHYCGFYASKRTTCATCGSENLRMGGTGTQRVEEDLAVIFPDARVVRMDLDTTSRKGAFKKILSEFASGNADILLGTQMVAKGLDFPRVTLVGVVSADTSLCLPDFRAGERTFQLLTQVSGRAGRSLELKGEVLIQTLQPGNPSIVKAVEHDYQGFFQLEMASRKALDYPPFSRLILIEFRGLNEDQVQQRAETFATLFPERASFYERLGPAPPSIPKLRNEYRWHLLIKDLKAKDPNGEKVRRLITGALDQYQKRFAATGVKVTVDVDVQGVL